MTLSKSLEKTLEKGLKSGRPCFIGSVLHSEEVPADDRAALQYQMEAKIGSPDRLTNAAVTSVLREEGFPVGVGAVEKHRRKECRCFGPNPKYMPIEVLQS